LLGTLKNRPALHKLESNYFLYYVDIAVPPMPSLISCLQLFQIHCFCGTQELSLPSVITLAVSGRDGKGFITGFMCDTYVTDQTVPTLKNLKSWWSS